MWVLKGSQQQQGPAVGLLTHMPSCWPCWVRWSGSSKKGSRQDGWAGGPPLCQKLGSGALPKTLGGLQRRSWCWCCAPTPQQTS